MKKIFGILLLMGNMLFAQSWTSAVSQCLTIGTNQTIHSSSDRNGVHVIYYAGGTLKYARVNSSGSAVVSDVTIATGIGGYAAITTYADKIYVVYEKNTDVYIARSTDGGMNWSAPITHYVRTNSFTSMSSIADIRGVHVAWSESGAGTNEAYYVLAKVGDQTTGWDFFKEVSDYGTQTGTKTTVAVSANEVHVTYQATSGYTSTRDFRIAETTPYWEDPVTLQYSPAGYSVKSRTAVIGSNVHVINLEYYYAGNSYTYNVRHYIRNASSTSFSTITLADEYNTNSNILNVQSTANGELHVFYNKRSSSNTHVKYNGSSWSTVTDGLLWSTLNHISVAGNDLFLLQENIAQSDKLDLRQYNNIPTAPTGMAIGTSNQITLNWGWNPEPDVICYEVWRKYYRSRFDQQDWTLKSTQSSNSWTDSDFQLDSPGNTYTVYYKTRAKDNSNQYSSYSSETSTSAVMVFNKKGSLAGDLAVPEAYSLKQNYPNPFNPSTTISFALPEAGETKLAVYDELGREVANLFEGYLSAGTFEAKFDAVKLSSGMYLYKLTSGKYSEVRRMMLVK